MSKEKSTLKKSLRRIEKGLKSHQIFFSRFIHNNIVERISELIAAVARPGALLMGGATFFFVSLAVLLICKYYGYEYNYLIGLISFPAGFIIGLAGEFVIKFLKK